MPKTTADTQQANAVDSTDPARSSAFTVFETVKGQKQPVIPPDYVQDETIALSENSLKVLERRYLRRDLDGTLLETPAGMFYRVAHHIAKAEESFNGDVDETTKTFYLSLIHI